MNAKKSPHTIRSQLLRSILPITLVPLILVALFTIISSAVYIKKRGTVYYAAMTNLTSLSIDFFIEQYADKIRHFFRSKEFTDSYSHKINTPLDELQLRIRLQKAYADFINYSGYNENKLDEIDIALVRFKTRSLLSGESVSSIYLSGNDFVINGTVLLHDPLYLEFLRNNDTYFVAGRPAPGVVAGQGALGKSMLLVRMPDKNQEITDNSVIVLLLPDTLFSSLYLQIKDTKDGVVFVVDKNNQPLHVSKSESDLALHSERLLTMSQVESVIISARYYGSQNLSLKNGRVINFNLARYLVTAAYTGKSGTVTLFFYPTRKLFAPLITIILVISLFTLLITAALAFLSFYLSSAFSKPLVTLSSAAYENSRGGFHLVSIDSKNEIGVLAENFNRMISEIRETQENLELIIAERTRELREMNERLESLDDLKNDFIANITHDFRLPLTVIFNTADLSLSGNLSSEDLVAGYKRIYDSSLKLKHTVERLLKLAEMDAKGVILHIEEINPAEMLKKVHHFFTSAVSMMNIEINLVSETHDTDNFYSDYDKLNEIIDNIMFNAIKFVDPEKGKIDIILDADNEYYYISVKDNGIGIPEDKLDSIFERFEHYRDSRQLYQTGNGIGLAYCRQLASFLKAEIFAHSEGVGKGAVFTCKLKKGKEQFSGYDYSSLPESQHNRDELRKMIEIELADRIDERGVVVMLPCPNREGEFDPVRGIILVVDDDRDIRHIIYNYLRLAGLRNVILASDGEEGYAAAISYKPDIIISDFSMPVMSGDKMHDRIIAHQELAHTPFIFLSAIRDRDIIMQRKQKGASAYLQKPIDEQDFIVTVNVYLKKHMEYRRTLSMAIIDDLTRLYNKKEILKRLLLELSVRDFEDCAVIFFDIDNFKKVNDTYGHQFGDEVLRVIGQVLKDTIREHDIPGRYGGEEFVVILPRINAKTASIVAEKIRSRIERTEVNFQNTSKYVTSSFGVTSVKDNSSYICRKLSVDSLKSLVYLYGETPLEIGAERRESLSNLLISMADQAMYRAKESECTACGYGENKTGGSVLEKCPQCGSGKITSGRNRVKVWMNGECFDANII